MGLTALFTAGENGEAIVTLLGDCAIAVPLRTLETAPGVMMGCESVGLPRSGFADISTWGSSLFGAASVVESGNVHGGAGGFAGESAGGFVVLGDTSELGASGISSTLGSIGFGVVASVSSI
jgi:hypothetical protein